ncbi:MAG: hypothetical protein Q4P36_04600 [Bowdeniella nasicola]|nr:hypothetical protein [Bowdeniella nasicola]
MSELPTWLADAVRCPRTGASLTPHPATGTPISYRTVGVSPTLSYPVREGIVVLLADEAEALE